MQKFILITGSLLGGLAVIVGAFGAHALQTLLETHERVQTFETAVKYQFYHSLALLFLGLLMYNFSHKFLNYSAWSFIIGIALFSGSLYILCLTNNPKWGAVAPIGGLAFIVGWILMSIACYKSL